MQAALRRAESAFQDCFGRAPRWLAAAPGRVNLIGEHTDYNDGFALPMAIDRYVAIAADRPTPADRVARHGRDAGDQGPLDPASWRVYSTATRQWASVAADPGDTGPRPAWSEYLRGVRVGCAAAGLDAGSLLAVVDSDVPLGGGLSSSAALEVAAATLVEAVAGRSLPLLDKVLLCQRAEHDFAGVPCGVMDQFAAVFGQRNRLLMLDCRALAADLVPLDDTEVTMLVINSNVRRDLRTAAYAQRRAECHAAAAALGVSALRDVTSVDLERARDQLGDVLYRRARHVVGENARVRETADAIVRRDWPAAGARMHASHASLRDDFEVSCPELDLLVALAEEAGVDGDLFGSRLTGGGFGGCTVSLVRSSVAEGIGREIGRQYHERTGIQASIIVSRPAPGATSAEVRRDETR